MRINTREELSQKGIQTVSGQPEKTDTDMCGNRLCGRRFIEDI